MTNDILTFEDLVKSPAFERLRAAIYEETTLNPPDEEVVAALLGCFSENSSFERLFRRIIRAKWEQNMRAQDIDPENPNFIRMPPTLDDLDPESQERDARLRELYRRINDPNAATDWDLIHLYQRLYKEHREQQRERERLN